MTNYQEEIRKSKRLFKKLAHQPKLTTVAQPRMVIKIGSNVIAHADGTVNTTLLTEICQQITTLHQQRWEVIVVSSGAVASGRSQITPHKKTDPIAQRQLWAAIGQTQLINTYTQLLQQHRITCAQVLVTKEDFRSRMHYLNIRHCLESILQHRVIPIINENDVVSITELMFTDNDELAGLVAAMLDADRLIILTNVDGIYDRHPADPQAQRITEATPDTDFSRMVSAEKSDFGRGGMLTKSRIARKLADMGVDVHIVNGKQPGVLTAVTDRASVGTHFPAQKRTTGVKRWISHAEGFVRGSVTVNDGAYRALNDEQQANSLLLVGVTDVGGDFEKNDVVQLHDAMGKALGIGKVQYDAETARNLIGEHGHKPLIHYDHLYLY